MMVEESERKTTIEEAIIEELGDASSLTSNNIVRRVMNRDDIDVNTSSIRNKLYQMSRDGPVHRQGNPNSKSTFWLVGDV